MLTETIRVNVIGLGYVGLPLAVALARKFHTTGLDIDARRVSELKDGHDRTGEISQECMRASSLTLTADPAECPPANFYIVTVPTPITPDKRPDLSLVEAACRTVASMVAVAHRDGRAPVVVFESTVYPGVTEDICGPLLEAGSGLTCGLDFFLAYSPERINPGDSEHTIDKITKVVSGQDPETLARVSKLYDAITSGGVFEAASIKAAEAAKVIENAQRDINIAFMNEITQVFALMNLSVWDVLAAARTKWNFLPFSPGLVGGHCIGVDPYYLSHRAAELGYSPEVILAGRAVNDGMARWSARRLHDFAGGIAGKVLVLGLTFKENVPDLRNSKVADLIDALASMGHEVTVHDPHADPSEAMREYGLKLVPEIPAGPFNIVLLAVPHRAYREFGIERLCALKGSTGILADLGGVLGDAADWTF